MANAPRPARWFRRDRRRGERADASQAPAATSPPTAAAAPRRTLHDDDLQAAFERDGYVVVDLLDAATTQELQRCYEQLEHTENDADSPWVRGFETSLYDGRREYREQVLNDVEHAMADPLDRVLVEHRIMFANYVVKFPHSEAVPPHADWTFLDEQRYRSATVWCPLVDTSVELGNGPLGVAVGSQERIDFLRIANLPAYDRCVEAVDDLPRAIPELTAGQAIVMDNRVVHFSPPNETDDLRVAVGCVVGPIEADLHHYWLDEQDRLLRFTLDRTFYLSYPIGSPVGTEGILAVDEVPAEIAAASR